MTARLSDITEIHRYHCPNIRPKAKYQGEVCKYFPNVIVRIVADYSHGDQFFWKHFFHDVLVEINLMERDDDSEKSQFYRTGITYPGLGGGSPEVNEYPSPRLSMYTKNIIHSELDHLLGGYDFDEHFGNSVTQLVYEYVGWEYGFKLAPSCYEIE